MKLKKCFNKVFVMITIIAFSLFFSCSSGNSISTKTLNYDLITSGDVITTATLSNVNGKIIVNFSSILDPSTGLPYEEADIDKIGVDAFFDGAVDTSPTAKSGNNLDLKTEESLISLEPLFAVSECGTRFEFQGDNPPKVDMAFLIDTTQSMAGAIDGVINTIDSFSQDLTDAGLDAKFALVTFGDAYNTKALSGSAYSMGSGADELPTFDPIERPLLDFSDLSEFKDFALEVQSNFQDYDNGGDNSENYFGTVMAMAGFRDGQAGLSKRDGALFHQVLIGDDCSHTGEIPGDTEDKWIPDPVAASAGLSGLVSVHAIRDQSLDVCSTDQLSLDDIADTTAGAKFDHAGGTIDLEALNLSDFITKYWSAQIGSCVYDTDSFLLTVVLEVKDSDESIRTQNFFFTVTLTTDYVVVS